MSAYKRTTQWCIHAPWHIGVGLTKLNKLRKYSVSLLSNETKQFYYQLDYKLQNFTLHQNNALEEATYGQRRCSCTWKQCGKFTTDTVFSWFFSTCCIFARVPKWRYLAWCNSWQARLIGHCSILTGCLMLLFREQQFLEQRWVLIWVSRK